MRLMKVALHGGFAAMAVLLSGCILVPGLNVSVGDSQPDVAVPYRVIPVTPETILEQATQQATRRPEYADLTPANVTAPPPKYVIGPGDVLQIIVWDHPELTNPIGAVTRDPVSAGQLVSADGMMFYPYAGIIQAAGKTAEQVRAELTDKLKTYIANPQVDVRVVAFRADRIQVTGEVKNPGTVTIDDTVKGLLEAIDERGGLAETASRRTAILIRDGQTYHIDLAALLSGSHVAINPLLEAGDIVQVPDSYNDQVFVLGQVDKRGALPLGQQQMTLTEALTKSGGLAQTTANDSGVLVFRRPVKVGDPAQIYTLDLSSPQGFLLAGEFDLQSRDVVYVKATKFAQYNLVINQMLPTISTVYQIDRLTD
ncbi:polysaccharide biosynthesis/export family protein [Solimonas marina]|uniref:Polysaccharide export outer membrane protein n=1 Tax=Solimonas marina TaxID=2714601 RepID=A0A969WBM6_9GAMM|nr:polysaccharide biosynthesis/export family protein [Solimonas marina]NKF21885.1 hypothetical protein [Solimonas marina]